MSSLEVLSIIGLKHVPLEDSGWSLGQPQELICQNHFEYCNFCVQQCFFVVRVHFEECEWHTHVCIQIHTHGVGHVVYLFPIKGLIYLKVLLSERFHSWQQLSMRVEIESINTPRHSFVFFWDSSCFIPLQRCREQRSRRGWGDSSVGKAFPVHSEDLSLNLWKKRDMVARLINPNGPREGWEEETWNFWSPQAS